MLPEFTVHHLLLNSAEAHPQRTAMVDEECSLTYADLQSRASRLARALRERGVRRGDRVGVYLDKRWEAVVAMLGIAQAGAVFVNISTVLRENQVRHIMTNCGVRALIGEADRLGAMTLPRVDLLLWRGEAPPTAVAAAASAPLAEALEAGSDGFCTTPATGTDLATIIYTSGSTGLPKGIMLSHQNLVAGAQIVSTYLGNTCEDRVLSVLPFNFDYGLNQLLTMLRVGGTLVLQRSLMPGDIYKALRAQGITGLAGVPTVWVLLLQNRRVLEREPLRDLRYITNSGGMIPKAHLEQLRTLLPNTRVFLMYGLTEAFRSTYLPPEEIHRGSACIGRAIPNTDIWVVNERGGECRPGEVGELIHRGPTVAMGYWGDEAKTNAVYRPNPFAPPEMRTVDRVVYSGDLVTRDEEGFLYFVGRRDELIKTSGYRVSPQEIEDILCDIPEVAEAAAFGQGNLATGQRIVAVVVLKDDAESSPGEITERFALRAPAYMVPQTVHILRQAPRTATGKLDRSALKHEYAA